jgi:hypothetical protein
MNNPDDTLSLFDTDNSSTLLSPTHISDFSHRRIDQEEEKEEVGQREKEYVKIFWDFLHQFHKETEKPSPKDLQIQLQILSNRIRLAHCFEGYLKVFGKLQS